MTPSPDTRGSKDTAEEQFIEHYAEIRQLAHQIVRSEAAGVSVEATSLAHEAYEKVIHANSDTERFEDAEHLLNALGAKMRLLLVDRARKRKAAKRGGHLKRESVDFERIEVGEMEAGPLLALSAALEELEAQAPESAQLVQWHIFLGMSVVEVGERMGISRSKADDLWLHARHWLQRKINELDAS